MNAIVACDENWAIGKNGKLLVHLPGDLQYYKDKTIGKSIVIGRKTLESFPGCKPLPKRENIVLTTNDSYEKDGCIICHSIEQVMNRLEKVASDDVFISGGDSVYKQFLPYCDTFYVTHILEFFSGIDSYFPNISEMDDIKMTWKSDVREEKGTRYYFAKYERIK